MIYIAGIHAVTSRLQCKPETVRQLFVLKGRQDKKLQEILVLAQAEKITVVQQDKEQLNQRLAAVNHQGVIAECADQAQWTEDDLFKLCEGAREKPICLLVLDSIQDPHNLGACLRVSDALGVDAVIAPKDKSVGLTPTVYKVASGAADTVPFVQVTNLARCLRQLQEAGVWIYGAAAEADQHLAQADLTGSIALVLGAEGTGLRDLTRKHCDHLVKIPMLGTVSSLNVSVSAGICLYEVVRQRNDS